MKPKKYHKNITAAILSGIVTVFILVIGIAGYIGYSSFTTVLLEQYSESAYLTANTATALVDGSRLEEYLASGGNDEEYQLTLEAMETLCNRQNATLIYVIIPDSDYSHITNLYNTVNENSDLERWEIGYRKETTNDDYKEAYRSIYEDGAERAMVVRDTGFIESGSHITELVPVKDGDKVAGILCVQKQMSALDEERTRYIKSIAFAMLLLAIIVAVLYALYLNKRLLKPIKTITKEAERFARETSAPERPLTSKITHHDEIGILASSIDKMTTDQKGETKAKIWTTSPRSQRHSKKSQHSLMWRARYSKAHC